VARQAVREDPAEEDQAELWRPVRRQHETEVALRVRQVEDAERERDRRDRRPEQRDELPGEEQPELALRECAQLDQSSDSTTRASSPSSA
jgi:hypothetical protein